MSSAQAGHELITAPMEVSAESSLDISMILQIGTREFVLGGVASDAGVVVNFSQPMNEAIDLGQVQDALLGAGKVLMGEEAGKKLYDDVKNFIGNLPDLLSGVANAFFRAHIVITKIKLEISADQKTSFTLGIGLLFMQSPPKIGGIELLSFLFEYTRLPDEQHFIRSMPLNLQNE